MRISSSKRRVAALAVAGLAVSAFTALAPSATGQGNPHAVDASTRVHWSNGKALGAASDKGAEAAVRGYLARGLGKATADSLRSTAHWSVRGATFLRLQQYAGGLRVVDSDIKAALDKQGRVVSVIENASRVGQPAAARISSDQARSAAVDHVYAGRTPSFSEAPSVERVAVPMSDGNLAEGFVVTTWDVDNELRETIVDGNGAVVRSDLRTAEDTYNVFEEDPDKSVQTPVTGPGGWLSGSQFVDSITGNNVKAYLDVDSNNKPDAPTTPVLDGVFNADFDETIQPSAGANRAVAVQNLFYLNNLIHDTLATAGFTVAAGNFEGNDPVLAEAQDGGGTDNANFATPRDGRSGRMQMYLWQAPGTSEVVQNGTGYDAPTAQFSAPLTVTGTTGPLVAVGDACAAIPAVAAGTIVLADRGVCAFVDKASNAKSAGAAGLIVANNIDGAPFGMGGTLRRFDLPAVMVSKADGDVLKSNLTQPVTIRKVDPAPPMKDGDLDSDIVWHEYGHGLTWRMIGQMSGDVSGGIGEGMSDVLSVIVNDDPIVGEYSISDPGGIRSEPYDAFTRTYADMPFTEVHDTGELYAAIGWDLWKRYQAAGLGQSDILFDLVQGMNFTPAQPTFEEMRDGILMAAQTNNEARACMIWGAFAKYGVGVGSSATVSHSGATVVESMQVGAGC